MRRVEQEFEQRSKSMDLTLLWFGVGLKTFHQKLPMRKSRHATESEG
jgi:hypothetical protein